MKKIYLALLTLSLAAGSQAAIRLPALLANGMVLQQKSQARLWGWSDPSEQITVTTSWNKRSYTVTATRDARWQLFVETPAAGGPYEIVLKGRNTIVLQNVLIGEVWLCSGQSNMEMNGERGLQDIKAELPRAAGVNVRFFRIPRTTSRYPQDDCPAQWTSCDSNTLNTFSAVGYFFGKHISRSLDVPVGLISASWGGTTAEVWTPDSLVHADSVLEAAAAKIPPSSMCPYLPALAYNAMIAPVTPYTIAGVIWYQGENNTGTAATYRRLFTTMIDGWRAAWNRQLPFYFVQIAPYRYRDPNVGALLREAQTQSMQHPATGMVVITDLVADTNDVHPPNKHDVGLRLANWALAETYGRPGIYHKSPFFRQMTVKGGKAVIAFDNAETGLVIKGGAVNELYIAGADRVFHPARAQVKQHTLVVWSPAVKQPVAVRYGFSNTATGNLFNKAGLPAGPFRTDDWPVQTKQ